MRVDWLDRALPSDEGKRLFAQELGILAATSAIESAMSSAGLSRADLANRIGRSRPFVSQVLSGTRNMTIRTLADLLWACGVQIDQLIPSKLGTSEVGNSVAAELLKGELSARAWTSVADWARASAIDVGNFVTAPEEYGHLIAGVAGRDSDESNSSEEEPVAEEDSHTGEYSAMAA